MKPTYCISSRKQEPQYSKISFYSRYIPKSNELSIKNTPVNNKATFFVFMILWKRFIYFIVKSHHKKIETFTLKFPLNFMVTVILSVQ